MAKKMLIDATHAEETRVVVLDGAKVDEFDFESVSKRQLAGNIYLAKVTRVEPSLQAAFVEYGGNRHGFLAFSEIHPDYYQIPVADREALLAEEEAAAKADEARTRARDKAEEAEDADDAVEHDDEDDGSDDSRRRRRSRRGGRTRNKRSDTADIGVDQAEDPRDAADPRDELTAEASGGAVAEVAQDPTPQEIPGDLPVETPVETPVEVPAAPQEIPSAPPVETPPTETAADQADETPDADPRTMAEDTGLDDDRVEEAFDAPEAAPKPVAEIPETEDASDDGDENDDDNDASEDGTGRRSQRTRSRARRGTRTRRGRNDDAADDDAGDDKPDAPEETGGAADDRVDEAPRRMRARRYKIQEVIKVRQIMLVQVVKEERGNKGAALTTYLSLAGRYCVLMPNTARGGGISRKITNAADRKKLKEIAGDMEVPRGMGLIVRTAGAKRTKAEIKRDYEFLLRQWEQIRELTLKSVAPALIYEEGSLIKRSIRDLFSGEIDQILVEGETGYAEARDYMSMLMPDHVKDVVFYDEPSPLFTRYQVETELNAMFNPVVQLRSGGYIVIGITEALVAVDVNSGKSTKEGSIEDTALKTNLEAADEVSRQMRLRDLAGLIVIDFIDMEEGRNNRAVEKRIKDALKTDRARIQCGRISSFGLMEMSRQRLRPGMLEATTAPCAHCHGTGIVRSPESMALAILRALEEEGQRNRAPELLVKAPVEVANWLMNQKREHLMRIEARCDITVRVEADPSLVTPQHSVERVKTPQRTRQLGPVGAAVTASAVYADAADAMMDAEVIEDEIPVIEAETVPEAVPAAPAPAPSAEDDEAGRKRRGRRGGRRRRRRNGEDDDDGMETSAEAEVTPAEVEDLPPVAEAEPVAETPAEAPVQVSAEAATAALPSPKRTRRRRKPRGETPEVEADAPEAADADATAPQAAMAEAVMPEAVVAEVVAPAVAEAAQAAAPAAMIETVAVPAAPAPAPVPEPEPEVAAPVQAAAEPEAPAPAVEPTPAAPALVEAMPEPVLAEETPAPAPQDDAAAPKRRGWWSR
ncbi:MAG: ribonuclease E [Paracoccaceae bacterium]|jgi:ribonuclease E